MHSGSDDIRQSIRKYLAIGGALFVFTVITVAVNQVHLAVPAAITVALIVATIKGSMVAAVFMHLSHEKKWIYGSLILTVVGFVVLMLVPIFTMMDTIGTHIKSPAPAHAATGAAGEHDH
jgi:cytochrome c oxidase subunit 4